VLLLLLGIWLLTRCGTSRITPPSLIYIPGGGYGQIAYSLKQQGIGIEAKQLKELAHDRNITSGWVRFDTGTALGTKAFVDKLLRSKREKTRRAVMYSGDTIHLFAQKLARQTKLSKDDLINAYYARSPYSDGGILAGYYRLPYNITPDAAMYYMIKSSTNKFKKISSKYGIKYDPKTFEHYLVIASIIQKETWRAEEMPLISSVIQNRLKRKMRLQLDGTLNYGPYAHAPVTPQRIRSDESRFNTYKHAGLPPEPIGSTSIDALESAFKPAISKYIFFVRGTKGRHVFSKNYQEHLGEIKSIQNEKAMILAIDQNLSSGSSTITPATNIKAENNSSPDPSNH
jgi:UPF0755 protein